MSQAARALLKWYDANKRDLPWRHTSDPYAIWVSETMLQQTTVAAVVPRFEKWMKRFPDVESLGRARLETVLSEWQGLGYYRRARNLHAAAKLVAKSGFPDSLSGWRKLPGVGEYTAGAVCSIAYGHTVPAIDANVLRVYSRVFRMNSHRGVENWVSALHKQGRPGDINQALMELGATVCSPRSPSCAECPIKCYCLCAERGDAEKYPLRTKGSKVEVSTHASVAQSKGRFGVVRFAEGEWWEGMYGFPRSNSEPKRSQLIGQVRHTVTKHKITLHIHSVPSIGNVEWKTPAQLAKLPMPSPDRKALAIALQSIGSKPIGTAKRPSSPKK